VPIVLFRVDERLIHGQVVVGWGERLHMDRVVVVDDELAASAWEQELYCLGVPPEVDAAFASVDDARQRYAYWIDETRRLVILVRDVETLARFAADGLLGTQEVNLGGIHHAPGRVRVLPYLHLNDAERRTLEALTTTGLRITARDLPGSRAVPVDELLGDG
jgi:mannose/fructose/N-acetylgalactosamine-specific phosphotransferase system component IIB